MQEPVIIGIANEYNQNHINTGHIKIQMLVMCSHMTLRKTNNDHLLGMGEEVWHSLVFYVNTVSVMGYFICLVGHNFANMTEETLKYAHWTTTWAGKHKRLYHMSYGPQPGLHD